MTSRPFLPAEESAWQPGGELKLQPGLDGHFGVQDFGATERRYIRRWIKGAGGVITFEYQIAEDEEFRAMADGLARRVRA